MNTFACHLRKDLRDQRGTLLALALVLALATLAAGFALPAHLIENGQLVQPLVVLGALIGAIAIAADLVPCEGERGTIALLARLPNGLRCAFSSKAMTVVIATLAFAALGYVTAMGAWLARFSPDCSNPLGWMPLHYGVMLASALAFGFWVLAIASWMPRGLPAIFALPLFAVPHALVYQSLSGYGSETHGGPLLMWMIQGDLPWIVPTQPLLALLVAYASFVWGRRWSGKPAASLRIGGIVALLALLPAWGTLAWRASAWVSPPVFSPDAASACSAHGAWIGRDGKYLFTSLSKSSGWPTHAYAIELATGLAHPIAGVGSSVVPLSWSFPTFPRHLVRSDYVVVVERSGERKALNGRDLGVVARDSMSKGRQRLDPKLVELFRESQSKSSACFLDGRLELRDASGRVESIELPKHSYVMASVGTGLLLSIPGKAHPVYDLTRKKLIERGKSGRGTFCAGRYWLVCEQPEEGQLQIWKWAVLDPDTGARSALPEELARSNVELVLADGRVLLGTRKKGSSSFLQRLVLATLPDGPFEEVALPTGLDYREGWYLQRVTYDQSYAVAEEEVLFSLTPRGGSSFATTYRAGATTLGPAFPAQQVLGRLDDDTILVSAGGVRDLERVNLRTGARAPISVRSAE